MCIRDRYPGVASEEADVVSHKASRILWRTGLLKSNLSSGECRALKDLRADTSITILAVDKRSAIVVLNTEDYNQKDRDMLDPATHKTMLKRSNRDCGVQDRTTCQTILSLEVETAMCCYKPLLSPSSFMGSLRSIKREH